MSVPRARPLSTGQRQAIKSLRAIAKLSRGALSVEIGEEQSVGGQVDVRVWLSSASLPHSERGIQLREWEPVDIAIFEDFPFSSPIAAAGHNDFDGLPHVARGSGFCFYASPNDWNPSAGMAGFLRQLIGIYGHISLGTLDGHLLPWRPRYVDPVAGYVVVQADLPQSERTAAEPLLRWAVGVRVSSDRVDIVDWLDFHRDIDQEGQTVSKFASDLDQQLPRIAGAFLVPALILPRPTAFEYIDSLRRLVHRAEEPGRMVKFFWYLSLATAINRTHTKKDDLCEYEPTALLFRAPADTRFTSADSEAHFAAALLAPADSLLAEVLLVEQNDEASLDSLADELLGAPVFWARVYDSRPGVVRRRSAQRPAGKLAGAGVLVLGCGALGAPIAEYCVRAGAAWIHVVDSTQVNPGILVRQPYQDADIGKPKADVLADRLGRIRTDTKVTASVADVLSLDLPGALPLGQPDLIIDATANRSVAAKIEQSRRHNPQDWPSLVTVAIGQTATAGVAAVSPKGSAGAGIDLLRRLGLKASKDPGLADIHDEFFPQPSQRVHFQPEPGCSDSTFIGSATDVTALAAQLLDSALAQLESVTAPSSASGGHDAVPTSLCIGRLGRDGEQRPARALLVIPHDRVLEDSRHVYQVRLDQWAIRQMRHIVRAVTADGGASARRETGGLLLGQFDEACEIAWVSEVTSPPPGSIGTPLGLELNIPEARDYVLERRHLSGGLLGHIGFWHIHPDGPASPSDLDKQTMEDLLGYAQRMLLLVLSLADGTSAAEDQSPSSWAPDMYAEVFTA
jgi:proteasome lid subunit RPN8/RPN11